MIKYETEVAGGREGLIWCLASEMVQPIVMRKAWRDSYSMNFFCLSLRSEGSWGQKYTQVSLQGHPLYTPASQTLHPQDPPSFARKWPEAGEQVFRHMTWGKGSSHKDHSRDQVVTDQFNEFKDASPVATWFFYLESFLQVFCCLGLPSDEA